jgi:hypothetical protein
MVKWEAVIGFPFSRFQKGFIFVCGGAADVAHSRQLADVQLPVFMGGSVFRGILKYLHRPLAADFLIWYHKQKGGDGDEQKADCG